MLQKKKKKKKNSQGIRLQKLQENHGLPIPPRGWLGWP